MNTMQNKILDHPFLAGLSPRHREILANCASEKSFDPGEILFREGEPADRFFLILEGKIAVESHQGEGATSVVQMVGAGEVLGWSWLFPPYVWHFRGRVLERTKAIVLDGAHLMIQCEENHFFGYELMKLISRLVIERLQAARKKLVTIQKQAGHQVSPAKS